MSRLYLLGFGFFVALIQIPQVFSNDANCPNALISVLKSGDRAQIEKLKATVIAQLAPYQNQANYEKLKNLGDISAFPNPVAENLDELRYFADDSLIFQRIQPLPFMSNDSPLTLAEKLAIADYTIGIKRSPLIVAGARKLPGVKGTFYRGGSIQFTESDVGKVISFDKFQSTSISREVAEGFLPGKDKSQLLIIKGKTLRDISPYSYSHPEGVNEREALILPGTEFKIKKIERAKRAVEFSDENDVLVSFFPSIVHLEEVAPK